VKKTTLKLRTLALSISSIFLITACGGGGADSASAGAPINASSMTVAQNKNVVEETREQDPRTFIVPDPVAAADYEAGPDGSPSFRALEGLAETDRWTGVLDGAAYRIEVPKNWNGKLVMYAHGYVGTVAQLRITMPSIRRHLIEQGYAWAASSYSKNWYDVRAGVEDTNALALNFKKIAAEKGRVVRSPHKTYIIGHSMGGHIAGAAIEKETYKTAINKQKYDGAVPMCGVMGDTELFDYFGAYQMAAQTLAGYANHPPTQFDEIAATVRSTLFTRFSDQPTAQGEKLREIVKNLTGGERPVFNQGFANTGLQTVVWGTFGRDGTVNGILNKPSTDTTGFTYQLDADHGLTAEEAALNAEIPRLIGDPDANRLRSDGLRWVPAVNGDFNVPVVSIHTLGDMYVPFSMQQIYRHRAEANGNGNLLVQRAVRAPSHCDFTIQEQVEAFDAMANWVENKLIPSGDNVTEPSIVANPDYGCAFSRPAVAGVDAAGTIAGRNSVPACSP
jgi:pimeloyl-ACP methyl ester carboxylesterase